MKISWLQANKTLQIKSSFGQTLIFTLLVLVAAIVPAEVITRTDWAYANLPTPGYLSTNPYLDKALLQAEIAAQTNGQIDCILLGSSMVTTDFNVSAFEAHYQSQTNRQLRCLNFGIPGLAAGNAAQVARALVHKYHPRLLIFGTAARDYSAQIQQANFSNVNGLPDNPWLKYHRGELSFQGWLIDTSSSYRIFLGISDSLKPSAISQTATPRPPINLGQPPSVSAEARSFEMLSNYDLSPESLAGLESILDLSDEQLQILVVEMPVHPTYLYFFGNGQRDQEEFQQQVAQLVRQHGWQYWPAIDYSSLPDTHWEDRVHLNSLGATVFSQWLAQQLAQAIASGQLSDPAPAR